MLTQTAFLLFAAVILVPLAKRAGLGAVLGYLVAGVLLGPWGLGLIRNVEAILHFGEFGVVLLLARPAPGPGCRRTGAHGWCYAPPPRRATRRGPAPPRG